MAERKAVNKYYPPDWDPRKQGSVNKRVGQHPLRDRARKLSQGILVIRFELPYNIWCGGCGNHVGMGVRYNAEKSKVGNYYSTPIYKFRMKCHLCDNYFEIQTDPKNHDYVILCGARRKEQRWDPVANEQIVPEDKATQKKMAMDAMYKLEHGMDDAQKGKEKQQSLAQLESSRLSMRDDYVLNRMARDKFRAEKKQLKSEMEADQAILDRGALDIELLEETEEDRNLAGLLKYSVTSSFEEKQREKRLSIEQRPIFESVSSSVSTPSSLSLSSHSSSSDPPTPSHSLQTRNKLSQILKSAGKDPFLINTPTSRSSLPSLGIRIKSPKLKKSSKSKSLTSLSVVPKRKHSKEDSFVDIDQASRPPIGGAYAKSDLPEVNNETGRLSSPVSSNILCTESNVDSDSSTSNLDRKMTSLESNPDNSLTMVNSFCDTSSEEICTEGIPSLSKTIKIPSTSSSQTRNSALVSLVENYDSGETSDSSDS